jgi:hypothetical protein
MIIDATTGRMLGAKARPNLRGARAAPLESLATASSRLATMVQSERLWPPDAKVNEYFYL